MNIMTSRANVRRIAIASILPMLPIVGCGPSYRTLRHEGMTTMATGSYGSAKWFFLQADQKKPRQVDNLYDLATCYLMLAKDDFQHKYYAAAMREVNNAIDFFGRAIDGHPGHPPALEGKRLAPELHGRADDPVAQFDALEKIEADFAEGNKDTDAEAGIEKEDSSEVKTLKRTPLKAPKPSNQPRQENPEGGPK